jgi:hypothetical protein
MNKTVGINLSAAALAVVLSFNGGVALAQGGSTKPPPLPAPSGVWPAAFPLPTSPGTLVSQSSTRVVVRSTDAVGVVKSKLDAVYVTQKGCTQRLAVNRPKDYLCLNPATKKTDEVYFFFAALDPTSTDPSRSQTTANYVAG